MDKNCVGCDKVFSFDEKINPARKFCGKECYNNHLQKKVVVESPLEVERPEGKFTKFLKKILKKY